jgi:hypothetical protein
MMPLGHMRRAPLLRQKNQVSDLDCFIFPCAAAKTERSFEAAAIECGIDWPACRDWKLGSGNGR